MNESVFSFRLKFLILTAYRIKNNSTITF